MVDVYGYAEVLVAEQWMFPGRMVSNLERHYEPEEPESMPEEFFHSYQKELAAILLDIDVPIRSIEPYTPVVPRRGLPRDLSPTLRAWLRASEEDDPSSGFTWFTAREVTEFGWEDRIMRRRAYVPREAASLFSRCPRGFPRANWPDGVPVSYAGWSADGVEVDWLESYAEIVPEFIHDVLPRLLGLGPREKVRLIIGAAW